MARRIAMQQFKIAMPPETHREAATCAEVDCPHYLHGWKTIVPAVGPQADYIRTLNRPSAGALRRHFTETRDANGMAVFVFPPGQRCFREHSQPSGRDPLFFYKRDPNADTWQLRPLDFNDLFNEESYKLGREISKG